MSKKGQKEWREIVKLPPISADCNKYNAKIQEQKGTMARAETKRIVKENGGDVVIGEYGRVRNANLLLLG